MPKPSKPVPLIPEEQAIQLRLEINRLNLNNPIDRQKYDAMARQFLMKLENPPKHPNGSPMRYDDKHGKVENGHRIGNWTVGTGFNMGPVDLSYPEADRTRPAGARTEWREAFSNAAPDKRPDFNAVYNGTGQLTQPEMDMLLTYTIVQKEKDILRFFGIDVMEKTTPAQRLALTSLIFNAGGGLIGPASNANKQFRRYILDGDEEALKVALYEIDQRSNLNKDPGTPARRRAEAQLMNTPDYDLDQLHPPEQSQARTTALTLVEQAEKDVSKTVQNIDRAHREYLTSLVYRLYRRQITPYSGDRLRPILLGLAEQQKQRLMSLRTKLNEIMNHVTETEQRHGNNNPDAAIEEAIKLRLQHMQEDLKRESFSQLDRLRQPLAGFTSYIWRSMDDPKVRAGHAANDDRLFSWDNPPATGHPGQEFGCRCTAEPVA